MKGIDQRISNGYAGKKCNQLAEDFQDEIDKLVVDYLQRGIRHADVIRSLSACQMSVTSDFSIVNTIETIDYLRGSNK